MTGNKRNGDFREESGADEYANFVFRQKSLINKGSGDQNTIKASLCHT